MGKHIVIFASGNGSNALNLIRHFRNSGLAEVKAVFTNNPEAGVIAKCEAEQIPVHIFNRQMANAPSNLDTELASYHPDLIVLAGYLWLFPERLVKQYTGRIINLHPALLPKYGGKGMWGDHVHRAVLESGDLKSGISIHFVNAHYDEGTLIAQETCTVDASDTVQSLAAKIHRLEQRVLPEVVEKLLG